MNYNLKKKEMKIMDTEDLNIRYCRILERAELLDAEEIPISDAREILYIEDILHRRLTKAIGHDIYPLDRIEEKVPSNYMITLLKAKQDKSTEKVEPCLSFRITITSSIGSVVKTVNVKVDSKSEANILAQEMIKQLGLKKATYKIS